MSPARSKAQAKAADKTKAGQASGRKRQETARAREGRENAAEIAAHHADKRHTQQERREDRRLDRVEDMLVEREDESAREAQYREFAAMMRAQNDTMAMRLSRMEADLALQRQERDGNSTPGASVSGPSGSSMGAVSAGANPTPVPAPGSILAPARVSEVTMAMLREHMGLGDNDNRWLEIRATIRDFMALATLDLDVSWKKQDKTRLGNLYALILERVPEFKRFHKNWPAELIVQDIFNHRRTFRNSKNRTGSPKPKRRRKAQRTPSPRREHSSHSEPPLTPPGETPPPGAHDSPSGAPTPPPPQSSPSPSPPPAPPKRVARKSAPTRGGAASSTPAAQRRRSERHAAAISAANAAAEDDQSAAALEKAKKGAAGKKAPGAAKGGRSKQKKNTTVDEDEDEDEDGLFPDQPEPCDEE